MGRRNKHKSPFFKKAQKWWEALDESTRLDYRNKYEKIRSENDARKLPYPHMVCTTNSKISTLTGQQINCIFRFKDMY